MGRAVGVGFGDGACPPNCNPVRQQSAHAESLAHIKSDMQRRMMPSNVQALVLKS